MPDGCAASSWKPPSSRQTVHLPREPGTQALCFVLIPPCTTESSLRASGTGWHSG